MLFNSIHFLIFFPIAIFLYYSLKHKYRWILLLIASYYFYMSWKAEYIVLIMFSTLVDYVAGHQIAKATSKARKKAFLFLSLFTNLGLLFTFKYWNFFNDALRDFLSAISIPFTPIVLKVLLPVGISFYTFQTLSYTIDVYNGKIKPEKHLGIFAVYVSFFPQLVAGPIERAKNLLPQFYKKHKFEYDRVIDGLKLMLWGFFKKVVIADRLAIYVNYVFNNVHDFTGLHLIIATIFFAFQIYCDFSGYSDIAIGAAQVMGFNLMDNFKRPYFARSISEFWKRWHISLSTWFRDYLYIPLGGNRVSIPRWYLNLFIVFAVSGLWHGANWTFIIWGALHGLYLVFAIISEKTRTKMKKAIGLLKYPKIHNWVQIGTVFVLVNLGWIFFRANSLSDAWYVVTHLFKGWTLTALTAPLGRIGFSIAVISILFMEVVHLLQEHKGMRHMFDNKKRWIRWTLYLIIIFSILLFGVFENTQFIYFQF